MKKSIRNERITNNVPRVALIRSKKYRLLLVENIHLFLQPLWPRSTVPVPI